MAAPAPAPAPALAPKCEGIILRVVDGTGVEKDATVSIEGYKLRGDVQCLVLTLGLPAKSMRIKYPNKTFGHGCLLAENLRTEQIGYTLTDCMSAVNTSSQPKSFADWAASTAFWTKSLAGLTPEYTGLFEHLSEYADTMEAALQRTFCAVREAAECIRLEVTQTGGEVAVHQAFTNLDDLAAHLRLYFEFKDAPKASSDFITNRHTRVMKYILMGVIEPITNNKDSGEPQQLTLDSLLAYDVILSGEPRGGGQCVGRVFLSAEKTPVKMGTVNILNAPPGDSDMLAVLVTHLTK